MIHVKKTLKIELTEALAELIAARAEELRVSEDKAVVELVLLGLERLGRVVNTSTASTQPKPSARVRRYYLQMGSGVYEVQAEHPRDAVVRQLLRLDAHNAALGAPRVGSSGQQMFPVVGLHIGPELINVVEVFTRYPLPKPPRKTGVKTQTA
jgi:hypothetical protein